MGRLAHGAASRRVFALHDAAAARLPLGRTANAFRSPRHVPPRNVAWKVRVAVSMRVEFAARELEEPVLSTEILAKARVRLSTILSASLATKKLSGRRSPVVSVSPAEFHSDCAKGVTLVYGLYPSGTMNPPYLAASQYWLFALGCRVCASRTSTQ